MHTKKRKISILGCGWLGFPLATHLKAKGYCIKGSTTSPEKQILLDSKKIQPFLIDIDAEKIEDSTFFITDVLIIAIPSKNYLGFQKLRSQIVKYAIKEVVFISSTSVYPTADMPIKETHKTKDTVLVAIEQLFVSNTNFKTTILRFGGLFGGNRLPGNFFKKGKKIKNPNGVVNMIHREDCIAIITEIIERKIVNEVFNACADTHPTRREFYTKAKLDIGLELPEFEEEFPIQMKLINSDKLKNALGYEFIHSNL